MAMAIQTHAQRVHFWFGPELSLEDMFPVPVSLGVGSGGLVSRTVICPPCLALG